MAETVFNEVETEPEWRCTDCRALLVHCTTGPLLICAYHTPPRYFRIGQHDRVIGFRVRCRAPAPPPPPSSTREDGSE